MSKGSTFIKLDSHGHGDDAAEYEMKNILRLFPGLYNTYRLGLDTLGPGVVVYVPETNDVAGYAPVEPQEQGGAITEMIEILRDATPNLNYVPVMFMYKCGHVSGYILTALISPVPGVPNIAEITGQFFGQVIDAERRPASYRSHQANPWEMDL